MCLGGIHFPLRGITENRAGLKPPRGYRSQGLASGLHSEEGHTFRKAASGPSVSLSHTLSHGPSRGGSDAQPQGVTGSCQVLHHEEHDHTGEQHPTDHEVLVLESPLLNEPHHCVGQAQHVGNVEDLLLSPLEQRGRERKTINLFLPRSGTLPICSLLVTPDVYKKQH